MADAQDPTLTDQQCQIREAARAFAAKEIAPFALEWDRQGGAPAAIYRTLGEAGFMGMLTPEAHGGSGLDFVSYVLATEAISGADGGICNVMNANNSPVCAALADHGSDAQKRDLLPRLACGEINAAFALTEPQAGSDAANLRTKAERSGDRYVLNGHKQFITAGQSAALTLIVAVTDPAAGKKGMSCFLVPTDTPGYTVARLEDKLGHRTCDTAELVFDDMAVPADALLGAEGDGYRIALAYLEGGRIGVAAQAVGAAQRALDEALAYARERETFGKPIIDHQGLTFKLADMATQVEAARQMVLHAARLKDAGLPSLKAASMAKLFATDMAEQVCSEAVQVFGGYGFCHGIVEKTFRDCRIYKIYEGTNEVQRLVIGRALAKGQ